ncbi:MAG: SDR family oxidoreductase [Hyphomicrobiales bacterium]|nr:MAG: SDR family oxidoreductase [Hyphomicrobiales bacterium]
MRILVTGASGFIGSAIAHRLLAEGHEVVAVARGRRSVPEGCRVIALDLRTATKPQAWQAHLSGIDAVVNCAGVLQDNARDSVAGAHRDAPAALFLACETAGVGRVIQISAIGVDRETPTAFTRTKLEGDRALQATTLDWVILRPSVVVGRAAYGGSALFRALALLPVLPRAEGAGRLQVVQLDDVVESVVRLLRPAAPVRLALDVAGPDALIFEDVVAAYRAWLRLPPARLVHVPAWSMRLMHALGDLAGWLGWRAPVRSTAAREILRGATGDNRAWQEATGIVPRGLKEALAATPATVQERWFAGLYLAKPAVILSLAALWIGTALVTLGPAHAEALAIMRETGAGRSVSGLMTNGGALADLAIGIGILFRRSARVALWAGIAVAASYAVLGTLLLPRLWLDPFAALLKIAPIIALSLVALATLEDR